MKQPFGPTLRAAGRRRRYAGVFGGLFSVTFAATLAISTIASAQEPTETERARAFFIEGSERVGKQDWAGARDSYEKSLALKRAAITLYSLAVAEERIGALARAKAHYVAFLAEPAETFTNQYREPAQAALRVLDARLARLSVSVSPQGLAGLSVTLDGRALKTEDVATSLDPGDHIIEVTAPNYLQQTRTVRLAEGERAQVTLRLEKVGIEAPILAAEPKEASEVTAPAPSHLLPIMLIGGGSTLFAVGATVGILGIVAAGDAKTSNGEDASAARVKMAVGDVLGGLGLVTAGVGVFLLLSDSPAATTAASATRILPWIAENQAGIAGTF